MLMPCPMLTKIIGQPDESKDAEADASEGLSVIARLYPVRSPSLFWRTGLKYFRY